MSDDTQSEDRALAAMRALIGKPIGSPSVAPDPVNQPMIRHWVTALDDRNPVYTDAAFAATTRFGGIVAPPLMLQTWTMPTPKMPLPAPDGRHLPQPHRSTAGAADGAR